MAIWNITAQKGKKLIHHNEIIWPLYALYKFRIDWIAPYQRLISPCKFLAILIRILREHLILTYNGYRLGVGGGGRLRLLELLKMHLEGPSVTVNFYL